MKILKQLSEAIGVSGAEQEVRQVILDLIGPHVDDIATDTMGNVIAFKKGAGRGQRMRVMLDAHMDEVGMMVTGHDSNGMLKVVAIGGLDDRILPGTRVLVGPKKIPGVIGAKPVHLVDKLEVVKLDAMRVDIGASGKDSAKGKAPIGTRVAFDAEYMEIGSTARGKAFDDRCGCAVLVHALQGDRYPFDLYGAFTVQEEVGLRGARIATHRIQPDLAFVLEGTIADDLPKGEDVDASPTTELGKGPALSLMDRSVIYDRALTDFLVDTAAELNIPVQFKQPGIGGTDGGGIQTSREGVRAAGMSVPCRYIHTPRALIAKRDYQNAVKLMQGALARLDRSLLKA